MSAVETNQLARKPPVTVNKVDLWAPLSWLSEGFSDLKKARIPSIVYGLTFAVIGLLLVFIASKNPIWSAALITAFLLAIVPMMMPNPI